MFDVMAAAVGTFHPRLVIVNSWCHQTELHLDRLVLIASAVILRFLNVYNGSFILAEATHFSALPLVRSVQEYLAVNLETHLENRMLDHLHPGIIKQLSKFVSQLQLARSPITRNNVLGALALEQHSEWLALQDFPAPIIRSAKQLRRRDSMKLSPPTSSPSRPRPQMPVKLPTMDSPVVAPQEGNDDIFAMDDEESAPTSTPNRPAPWKARSTPR